MTAKEGVGRREGKRALRLPLVMRLSECMIRFLLAGALAGADIFGGHALFGLAMVGATGAGAEGLAALLGAAVGYLTFRGFLEGLRYIAASMMIFAVALAAYDFRICRRVWFMPLVSAALNGLVGFVYLSAGGWTAEKIIAFLTEVVLTAGVVYFYRLAFSVWEEPRDGGLTVPQLAGVLVLGMTVLMTLSGVLLGDVLSVGHILASAAVMAVSWRGRAGAGAAAGVAAGLAMDLSAAPASYTMAYAFSGLMAGVFSRQGRVFVMAAYLVANTAAVLWTWAGSGQLPLLWEATAGAAVFLLLPDRLLRRLAAVTRQEGAREEGRRTREHTARRLRRTAAAYQAVSAGVEDLFRPGTENGDASRIFDRAAERVCAGCSQCSRCWQQEYQTVRTALNDALPPMLDRGEGLPEDFPDYFARRCVRFRPFLQQVNRELESLLARRMYMGRLRESRAAVCAQYRQLAGVLEQAAAEVSAELTVDVRRQRLVKQRLAALGLEGRCAVFSDEYRRLRLELEGENVERLGEEEELEQLSRLMGCPLRVEKTGRNTLCLAEQEPYMAVAGVAALGKDGVPVSGDSGAWFKDGGGRLCVLLCDGMGTGLAARRDSDTALRLMEAFLRAGMTPETVLDTVGEALGLRCEAEGGFTTVDLLTVDLFTGRGAVYKLGAAPTYLLKSGSAVCLAGATLPAGLEGNRPDVFPLELRPGDWVVMVSDGITSGREDRWIRTLLEEFEGASPQALGGRIHTARLENGGGEDDRTVIALRLDERK